MWTSASRLDQQYNRSKVADLEVCRFDCIGLVRFRSPGGFESDTVNGIDFLAQALVVEACWIFRLDRARDFKAIFLAGVPATMTTSGRGRSAELKRTGDQRS